MPLYHYHDSYEIYYLLSGTRYYFIKDRTFKVEKGDLVLINKYDLHKTTYGGSQTHERILFLIDEAYIRRLGQVVDDIDVLQPFRQSINVIKLQKNEQLQLEQFFFRILKEAREKTVGSESSIRLAAADLLIFIARRAMHLNADMNTHPDQMHEKVTQIVRYINARYMEKLTLGNVSETFFISPYYLSRLFKKVTGFTFVEYLNSIRIREAQRLLKETEQSVGRIADKTGYESATHFGRVFKEITGLSPLRFRKISKQSVLSGY
jgi:YesN/AraC family two-component response regulator